MRFDGPLSDVRAAPLDETSHAATGTESAAGAMANRRLLIVSNRLPVTVSVEDGRHSMLPSSGGLATGLRGPHLQSNGLWIGWPGPVHGLDAEHEPTLGRELAEARIVPVSLDPDEAQVFYEDLSNGVIWPLFHDRLDRLPLHSKSWDAYEAVSDRFAEVVAAHYRPGDLIWIHDYQLLRVPALVRLRAPDACIGFFLHIPFPNPDVFSALPVRELVLGGMLGADLIGFHTRRYQSNFLASVERVLSLEARADGARASVVWDDRTVAVGAFPMGVDTASLVARATSRAVTRRTLELRSPRRRMLLGVDRLDYSKGIPRRLLAFEQLLLQHPEWRGRVQLVQVAVPSRGGVGAYRKFRSEVEGLVGRINGAFATPQWAPIQYMHRSVTEDMLVALYRSADAMVVTPVRDGMNLVAKEFVASRTDEDGVLVLSEFAGAAEELGDALLVNPYDIESVARALHTALTMPRSDRHSRMRALRARVLTDDVHAWASSFIAALGGESDTPSVECTPPR